MKVLVIRHGESEANRQGTWQGQSDSPLSTRGRKQAESLAKRLGSWTFDAAYCSDLTRAVQTAKAVTQHVQTAAHWREIDVGAWEGLTRSQVLERFPEEIAAVKRGDQSVKLGGGESWTELHARVDRAWSHLTDAHPLGTQVLLVVHGGVIKSLVAGVLGIRHAYHPQLGDIKNTSLTTIEVVPQGVRLESFNDTSHLDPNEGARAPWQE